VKYSIGDHVKIIKNIAGPRQSMWIGVEGIITSYYPDRGTFPYHFRTDDGRNAYVADEEITLVIPDPTPSSIPKMIINKYKKLIRKMRRR
jgi:hypothetical protein